MRLRRASHGYRAFWKPPHTVSLLGCIGLDMPPSSGIINFVIRLNHWIASQQCKDYVRAKIRLVDTARREMHLKDSVRMLQSFKSKVDHISEGSPSELHLCGKCHRVQDIQYFSRLSPERRFHLLLAWRRWTSQRGTPLRSFQAFASLPWTLNKSIRYCQSYLIGCAGSNQSSL